MHVLSASSRILKRNCHCDHDTATTKLARKLMKFDAVRNLENQNTVPTSIMNTIVPENQPAITNCRK